MNTIVSMRPSRMIALAFTLAAMLCFTGCESTAPHGSGGSGTLSTAYDSYRNGNYAAAYSQAKPIADGFTPHSAEAAYLTGLAAFQLRNGSEAERYLHQAARGEDRTIGGQALAMIGRIYAGQSRHDRAIETYAEAARRLTGEDRANALFYTALSQQSLGHWEPARVNLVMAKQTSRDAALISKIDSYLGVRGWTVQLGAYSDQRNAQNAATNISGKTNAMQMGSPRLIPATDAGGRKLVLVQVGQFPSEAAATAAKSRLSGAAEVVPMMAAK